ncbi:MAG: hypothetical protein V7701_16685, partial [Sneathiella sp.]
MLFKRVLILPTVIVAFMFYLPAYSKSAELSNFPKSIFEQDDFFPLAVVTQDPENVERFQELGINLYVGLWKGPTEWQLARLKKANMPVMTKMNEVGLNSDNNTIIAGWLMQDEPDNAQPIPGTKEYGQPIPPNKVIEYYQHIRDLDPSR